MSIEAGLAQASAIVTENPQIIEAKQKVLEPLMSVIAPLIDKIAHTSYRSLLFIADLSQRLGPIEPWRLGGIASGITGIINFLFHDSNTTIAYSVGLSFALGITGTLLDPSGGLSAIALGGFIGSTVGKVVGEAIHSHGNKSHKIYHPTTSATSINRTKNR